MNLPNCWRNVNFIYQEGFAMQNDTEIVEKVNCLFPAQIVRYIIHLKMITW